MKLARSLAFVILCAVLPPAFAAVVTTSAGWQLVTDVVTAQPSQAACVAAGNALPPPIRSRTWYCREKFVTKVVADPAPTPAPTPTPAPNPAPTPTPAPTGALYSSDCTTKGPGAGSAEIASRDGSRGVCKISIDAGGSFFGDKFASAELRSGDDIWVKIDHYFPASFCAGFINATPAGDGNGATKWLRMDWGGPTGTTQQRFTLELGGFTPGTCGPGPNVWGAVPEISTDWGPPYNYEYTTKTTIPRDRWVSWQFHMKLATTRAGSVLEQWLDDKYLGKLTPGSATMPASPQYVTVNGARVDFYVGNYWNGKALKSSTMYMDNFVITKTPNAKDSGGRPYIAP